MDKNKPPLYIFLDVDGVLNNVPAFALNDEKILTLSEECLFNYQYLVNKLKEKYEVKVILSSTWRFNKKGFNKSKEYEIKRYCDRNKIDYKDILVIDDSLMINELRNRSIKTDTFDGLKFSEVQQCLVDMFGWE